jgi:hypothetical protein
VCYNLQQVDDKLDACHQPAAHLLENPSVFYAIAALRKLPPKALSPLSAAC